MCFALVYFCLIEFIVHLLIILIWGTLIYIFYIRIVINRNFVGATLNYKCQFVIDMIRNKEITNDSNHTNTIIYQVSNVCVWLLYNRQYFLNLYKFTVVLPSTVKL